MISIGTEPEGLLLKKGDVMRWANGLTEAQWDKIKPHLQPVKLPGCSRPFYRKNEIKRKIIEPMQGESK